MHATPGSDLSETRYGKSADALAIYEQAAWLTTQHQSQPTSQYGDLQATIWQLFDPAAPTPGSIVWAARAKENYASMVFTDFRGRCRNSS